MSLSPRHLSTLLFPLTLMTYLLSTLAAAQTLSGAVKNSTTGKPAPGDEVILLSSGQGMEEVGHTKTDLNGKFSFKIDKPGPYLVRAIHQGITYHRMALRGTTSVGVDVYDVATNVSGIKVFADIMRIQPSRDQLAVTRQFGVQNSSNPPRTQMSPRSLEFQVPDGAQIIDGSATGESGYPLKSIPLAEGEKDRYSFIFPLRPGLTRFAVTYRLPYTGSIDLDPKSIYPLEHFVVILPKTMQFNPVGSSTYKPIRFPNQPDSIAEVASDAALRGNLAFNISGEGVGTGGQNSAGNARSPQSHDRRPGGGLGLPIDAADPLQEYRWWIVSGLAAVLLLGGISIARRQHLVD